MFLTYLQALLLCAVELTVLISSGLRTEYFLCSYLIFRPLLQSVANLRYKLSFIPISGVSTIVFIVIGILILFKKANKNTITVNGMLLLTFVLFSIPSFSITPNITESFNGLFKQIGAIVCYFLALKISCKIDGLKSILWGLFLSQLIPVTYAVYQKFTNSCFNCYTGRYEVADRINSTIGSSNDYGIYLAIILISAIALLYVNKNKAAKLAIYSIISLNLFSLLFSKNRGTWIALSFSIIVSSMIYFRRVKIVRILIVFIAVGLIATPTIIERFSELNKTDYWGQSQDTFSGRIHYFQFLLPEAIKMGFIGHGISSIPIIMKGAPHNDYLRILFEMGIIPLVLYCLFLSRILLLSLRKSARQEEYWYINYCMLMLIIYQIIISMVQHPSYNLNNFPQFLTFVGLWEGSRRSKSDN